jgi:hypothetical protein
MPLSAPAFVADGNFKHALELFLFTTTDFVVYL